MSTTARGEPVSLPGPRTVPAGYARKSYAVWEITLRCNLACIHCGSRAGPARERELTTEEALDLVRQLAEVGIGEVSLIGGEAYLRPDWPAIAAAIVERGMLCSMTTGGYGLSEELARRIRDAGIAFVSVSVDGLEAAHDRQRGRPGSWRWCWRAMENLRAAGVLVGCNTQLNRLSSPDLPALYEHIRDAGATAWQPQMTVPMGNAADNAEILHQPPELLDLYPVLARVAARANREGVIVQPGSSVGYYGPYEHVLRADAHARGEMWMGCQAGLATLGIEADGTIKGDPSLPTDDYAGGNIREAPLKEILKRPALTFNMGGGTPAGVAHLWGYCAECRFAALCRGGCSWTAHVFFDRRGNNPYCHHRALEMARRGLRERLVRRTPAPGIPFDNGIFEVVVEPADAPWPEPDPLRFTREKVVWPRGWEGWPPV